MSPPTSGFVSLRAVCISVYPQHAFTHMSPHTQGMPSYTVGHRRPRGLRSCWGTSPTTRHHGRHTRYAASAVCPDTQSYIFSGPSEPGPTTDTAIIDAQDPKGRDNTPCGRTSECSTETHVTLKGTQAEAMGAGQPPSPHGSLRSATPAARSEAHVSHTQGSCTLLSRCAKAAGWKGEGLAHPLSLPSHPEALGPLLCSILGYSLCPPPHPQRPQDQA